MFAELPLLYTIVLALAALLVIAAATIDARSFRIPNLVPLALLALFPLYVFASPFPVAWIENLAIFALTLAAGLGLYAKKWAGAGDIKLMVALSLWAGPAYVLMFLFITTVAGGLLALAVAGITWRRARRAPETATVSLAKTPIPYGVAIAIGGLCTLIMLTHPVLPS
ncbi:MAG: hypothetical protein HGA90_02610 [Alphaproteobacteria bacterium]|nr:hypothetical protein [Alphaproteobacteria bacterium]